MQWRVSVLLSADKCTAVHPVPCDEIVVGVKKVHRP